MRSGQYAANDRHYLDAEECHDGAVDFTIWAYGNNASITVPRKELAHMMHELGIDPEARPAMED